MGRIGLFVTKGSLKVTKLTIKGAPVTSATEAAPETTDLLLTRLEPWIYRKYLSLADITGIKSLKRRIEQRAEREGGEVRNVKTGNGGIRDIEFVIQFLQLLNGGALPEVRTGNTLEAIARLRRSGVVVSAGRS